MWADFELYAIRARSLVADRLSRRSEQRAIPLLNLADFPDRNGYTSDSGHTVFVTALLGNALRSRRYIFDEKRRHTAMTAGGEREQPLEFIAVRPFARPRYGVVDRYSGALKFFCVAGEIVGLKTKVDQAFALGERLPPTMIDGVSIEGDDFQIRTVLKRNQGVVTADRMPPADSEGEMQEKPVKITIKKSSSELLLNQDHATFLY